MAAAVLKTELPEWTQKIISNYVDFRDRWGTQKPFLVWHREDPRGGPPPPKMAQEPIPEGNDP